jgi:hypothetical protein
MRGFLFEKFQAAAKLLRGIQVSTNMYSTFGLSVRMSLVYVLYLMYVQYVQDSTYARDEQPRGRILRPCVADMCTGDIRCTPTIHVVVYVWH